MKDVSGADDFNRKDPRAVRRRDEMRIKPLDKHYGMRFPQYTREQSRCEVCQTSSATVKIANKLYCDKCYNDISL